MHTKNIKEPNALNRTSLCCHGLALSASELLRIKPRAIKGLLAVASVNKHQYLQDVQVFFYREGDTLVHHMTLSIDQTSSNKMIEGSGLFLKEAPPALRRREFLEED